jgi:hypothetical protein
MTVKMGVPFSAKPARTCMPPTLIALTCFLHSPGHLAPCNSPVVRTWHLQVVICTFQSGPHGLACRRVGVHLLAAPGRLPSRRTSTPPWCRAAHAAPRRSLHRLRDPAHPRTSQCRGRRISCVSQTPSLAARTVLAPERETHSYAGVWQEVPCLSVPVHAYLDLQSVRPMDLRVCCFGGTNCG